MLRHPRLLPLAAITAAALALGGCTTVPYGNSGVLSPYNPYPGYQTATTPAPVTANNHQGRGQVVNVQTLQGGTTGTTQGAGALIGGLAGGAIGIGEITSIPTAPAIAEAYYRFDGRERTTLPLEDTPYFK